MPPERHDDTRPCEETPAPAPPRRRPRRLRARRPAPLTVARILAWADGHFARTGRWPRCTDQHVRDDLNEKWCNIDAALRGGQRGLPKGSSLPRLLAQRRGVRNLDGLPDLTEGQIAGWAAEQHRRAGEWPDCKSHDGPPGAPGEKWVNLDAALRLGMRGLPGGSSLPQLLAECLGVRNLVGLPDLTEGQILAWADAHHARTGRWPRGGGGPVADAPGEWWRTIGACLREGRRGLPGGSSLARLLQQRRGVRNVQGLPDLAEARILRWAKAHRRRTGRWPRVKDGPVADAPGETWLAVDSALREGLRGLTGGSSLARLLAARLGVRNQADAPRLTEDQVLAWADAHHRRTGRWPGQASGPVRGAPGESWASVERSLQTGLRGLPGGSSVAQLLAERRGVRNPARPPRLRVEEVLAWARAHRRRTGGWPNQGSGPLVDAPGETWAGVNAALRYGLRGLPGGDSLGKLLARRFGIRNQSNIPRLTVRQILRWAREHRRRTGRLPSAQSGAVAGVAGETWAKIDEALKAGHRGLEGGETLARLLRRKGGGSRSAGRESGGTAAGSRDATGSFTGKKDIRP
jgi:hypothetical protein